MCVIIYKPHNIKISKADIKSAWNNNPHGMGLAYFVGSDIRVHKGIMDLKNALNLIKEHNEKDLIIHFRYATHGEINEQNTHPFEINKDMDQAIKCLNPDRVLFHNGVLASFGSKNLSDTLDFTYSVLSRIDNLQTQLSVLESVGCKYVLLDRSKGIHLIGNFEDYKGMKVSNKYSFNRDLFWTTKSNKYNSKKYFDSFDYTGMYNGENIAWDNDLIVDYPTCEDFKKYNKKYKGN